MIRKQSSDTLRFLFGSLVCYPALCLNSPLRGSDSGSGAEYIANLTTEALLSSVRFVFESLWLFLFTYHMYLKYHAFYLHMSKQDSYYQGVGTTFSP